jgi:hypothetical protein
VAQTRNGYRAVLTLAPKALFLDRLSRYDSDFEMQFPVPREKSQTEQEST